MALTIKVYSYPLHRPTNAPPVTTDGCRVCPPGQACRDITVSEGQDAAVIPSYAA